MNLISGNFSRNKMFKLSEYVKTNSLFEMSSSLTNLVAYELMHKLKQIGFELNYSDFQAIHTSARVFLRNFPITMSNVTPNIGKVNKKATFLYFIDISYRLMIKTVQ